MRVVVGVLGLLLALPAAALEVVSDAQGIRFTQGGRELLVYRTNSGDPSDPRAGFVHPFVAPNGIVLTENAPTDHPHQRGIFWAWRQILVDGRLAANSWLLQGLSYEVGGVTARTDAQGRGQVAADINWIAKNPASGAEAPAIPIVREHTELSFTDAPPVRRLDIRVELHALRPDVALGGSPDDKGYGGISFRFRDAQFARFAAGANELTPQVGPVNASGPVTMTWDAQSPLAGLAVEMSCRVDGRPQSRWVLRREPSMQNCAWPGPEPVALDPEHPLVLEAALSVR